MYALVSCGPAHLTQIVLLLQSVGLATETLGGEFTGLVFFPVDLYVFYIWM